MSTFTALKILLLPLALALISHEKEVHLKLSKAYCHTTDKYVRLDRCQLTPMNRHISYLNIEGFLKRKLKSVWCHGQLFKQDHTTAFKPYLVNVTLDICGFLAKKYNNFYATVVLKEFQKSTNLDLASGCPVKPLYFRASNFSSNPGILKKIPVENGVYRLVIDYYEKKGSGMELVFGFDLYVSKYYSLKRELDFN